MKVKRHLRKQTRKIQEKDFVLWVRYTKKQYKNWIYNCINATCLFYYLCYGDKIICRGNEIKCRGDVILSHMSKLCTMSCSHVNKCRSDILLTSFQRPVMSFQLSLSRSRDLLPRNHEINIVYIVFASYLVAIFDCFKQKRAFTLLQYPKMSLRCF